MFTRPSQEETASRAALRERLNLSKLGDFSNDRNGHHRNFQKKQVTKINLGSVHICKPSTVLILTKLRTFFDKIFIVCNVYQTFPGRNYLTYSTLCTRKSVKRTVDIQNVYYNFWQCSFPYESISKPSHFMETSGNVLVLWWFHGVSKNIGRKFVSNFMAAPREKI